MQKIKSVCAKCAEYHKKHHIVFSVVYSGVCALFMAWFGICVYNTCSEPNFPEPTERVFAREVGAWDKTKYYTWNKYGTHQWFITRSKWTGAPTAKVFDFGSLVGTQKPGEPVIALAPKK